MIDPADYEMAKLQARRYLLALNFRKEEGRPDAIPEEVWNAEILELQQQYDKAQAAVDAYEAKRHPGPGFSEMQSMSVDMGEQNGFFILKFGQSIKNIGMPPEHAIEFGESIIMAARHIIRKAGE